MKINKKIQLTILLFICLVLTSQIKPSLCTPKIKRSKYLTLTKRTHSQLIQEEKAKEQKILKLKEELDAFLFDEALSWQRSQIEKNKLINLIQTLDNIYPIDHDERYNDLKTDAARTLNNIIRLTFNPDEFPFHQIEEIETELLSIAIDDEKQRKMPDKENLAIPSMKN